MTKKYSELALFGGKKTINYKFEKYNSIGDEELIAAQKVIKSGVLSRYLGAWDKDFYGGEKVQEFESMAASFFKVKHAITVNSWTSGLICAIGAIGIEPGDEVIVTPWTMSATATAILHWNAIPVFADIDFETYNLLPSSIEANITEYTRAIVVADIFGQSAEMDEIMQIAKRNNLKVISDTAQSPGATYNNKFAGTIADIGGYSLNYHKIIHTGEGGILVTNCDELAERMRLIRNHAEVVVKDKKVKDISNMIGHNFRLGEIECAIGIEQLKKLPTLNKKKQFIAEKLTKGLSGLTGLTLPKIAKKCNHVYYAYPMQVNPSLIGVEREKIWKALAEEGLSLSPYYQNIHLLPIYQKKIAYGTKGFPWNSDICKREVSYKKGICPNAESLHDNYYLGFGLAAYELNENDIAKICETFHKVWRNLDCLCNS